MISSAHEQTVRTQYQGLKPELDERGRCVWAATEALSLGHGGVAAVARATGLAESTIRLGKRELAKRSNPTLTVASDMKWTTFLLLLMTCNQIYGA
jgi:hypothetical protein